MTVQPVDPRPSPADELVRRYEALRRAAGGETGDDALGRALLVHRGMAAWIEAWGNCRATPATPREGVPCGRAGELWGRVVGNSWVEQLGHGNLEEALAVRVLPDAQGERPQLFAHFQADLVLTMERANDGAAERFLRALLLESDAQWSADLRQHRQWLTSLGEDLPNPAASRAWNAAADGGAWILDGLLRCLVQLEAVLGWAEVIQGRSFDESETSPYSSLAPPGAEEVLVTSVGRILSWRLYRGNGQVRDRLEEAVGLAGDVERLLVDAQTIASPWPEGLRATVDRTLDRWETIASQRVFG